VIYFHTGIIYVAPIPPANRRILSNLVKSTKYRECPYGPSKYNWTFVGASSVIEFAAILASCCVFPSCTLATRTTPLSSGKELMVKGLLRK
jgi:hypothetical protein